jgi:hypothetical protein
MNNPIVRADRVDFQLAPGHVIEFFRLPSGEKRISKSSAAKACGLGEKYFYRVQSATPKQLEALQSAGFTGYSLPVSAPLPDGRGSTRSDTLSLDDFRIVVTYAAFTLNKKKALALASGMIGVAIETIAKQAFGEEALTLEEIRRHLCKAYAKTINWAEEDKLDFEEIENHQIFLEAS